MGEFELIRRFFFTQVVDAEAGVVLGIGDDAALLQPTPNHHLVVTTDTLVEGVHFLADDDPASLGHKALAVNLSDLAAMGARPRWVLLNLSLPTVDEDWLQAFADGLLALARQHGVRLVGGDTVRGALNITITALGERPASAGQAMRRSGAQVGDWIAVSGVPGEAALGLAQRLGRLNLPAALAAQALARLHRPTPRVELGLALRDIASSAVDISDGLAQDLGHILTASGVGATLELAKLPRSPVLDAVPQDEAWQAQLAGGDDYELLFTLPASALDALAHLPGKMTLIGRIEAEPGLRLRRDDGSLFTLARKGHDHFA
ncbi:MAG: thiamine-phosphate kinase [Gammaproteobacteria bacterium 28-57-27]|nr:MAG: thiamine-phosphate kinase [Gammaproteobacteria bacterium 28-57-27]